MREKGLYILAVIGACISLVACGNDVATNETDQNASESVISDNAADEPVVNETESEITYVSENSNDNIYIANMCGRDLKMLTFSFSAGDIQNQNILGEKKLNDGQMFTYTVSDMLTLRNTSNLKLTVTAVTGSDEEISFDTISVVDPSGMILVLDRNNEGYCMYIK